MIWSAALGESEPLAEARGVLEIQPTCSISYPPLPRRALIAASVRQEILAGLRELTILVERLS